MADGEPLDIIGVEDAKLKMLNRSVWKIQKVRHVPGLMRWVTLWCFVMEDGKSQKVRWWLLEGRKLELCTFISIVGA